MTEHGAYTLLLDACYDREDFPTLEQAMDWCWARTEEEQNAVKFVLSKFFTLIDNKYIQNRIQEEVNEYHAKAQVNKRIAIEREQKRKENSTIRAQVVNEPTPNHKPRTINQEPRTNKELCTPEGVSTSVFEDFVKLRKGLKAPVTETALKGLEREARKAGISLQEVLELCCQNGWRGFKAEWLQNNRNATQKPDKMKNFWDQINDVADFKKLGG